MITSVTPDGQRAPAMTRQQVLDLARAAHQAPSIHNTQPWRLHADASGLDLHEDATRGLPGTDPLGRDRMISCGAALRNAELTMTRLGYVPLTTLLPDGLASTHVARLRAGAERTPTPTVEALYRAIWERRTHRRIFMAARSLDQLMPPMAASVTAFGARLAVLKPARRRRFAELVWSAVQKQVRDEQVRLELSDWTRPDRTRDGVPAGSLANAPFPVDGLLTHTRAITERPPPWMQEDLAHGTIAVLLVPRDGRLQWLQAGRALENLLLTLTHAGLVASFLNQAVQQEEFRSELAAVVDATGAPQVVLRIGEPLVTVPPTPRRPLSEVLSG